MYNDTDLIDHVHAASSIKTQSFVYAEINMNDATNIDIIGNYRNRPYDQETIQSTFVTESESTPESARKYLGYTDSDTVVNGGLDDGGEPLAFISQQEKNKMLFSLEDCFGKFRPRSGINKTVFFSGHFAHNMTRTLMSRPRYYMADKDDSFKYWTSFRTQPGDVSVCEVTTIQPIIAESVEVLAEEDWFYEDETSSTLITSIVTYKYNMKITFTNNHTFGIGEEIVLYGLPDSASGVGLGIAEYNTVYTILETGSNYVIVETGIDPELDPEDGGLPTATATTIAPKTAYVSTQPEQLERGISKIKVANKTEYLIDDAAPFVVYKEQVPINRVVIKMQTNVGTQKTYGVPDGTPDPLYDEENVILNRTVPIDWRVEYLNSSNVWTEIASFDSTDNATSPVIPRDGYIELQYSNGSWTVGSQALEANTPLVTELTSPTFVSGDKYKEFLLARGVRVVVNSMSRNDVTFDLIELSPRLAVDLSSVTAEFSISKTASDLGSSGMPVGQLLASQGSITLSDYEGEFNSDNPFILSGGTVNPAGSVISKYVKKGMQFKFYEVVKDVLISENVYNDAYVPLKALYSESFPEVSASNKEATLSLRDAYYYFEELQAPQLLLEDVSLSYAIAMILDSVGFTNYVYKRSPNDVDPVIRHFFVAPKTTVAKLLEDLAVSTQTAMFFDEYNNLTLMSKRYIMPEIGEGDRAVEYDDVLIGRSVTPGDEAKQPNIVEVTKNENTIYNDGTIKYSERYIQKQVSKVSPAPMTSESGVPQQKLVLPNEQKWVYSSVLLWQPTPSEKVRPSNSDAGNTQSGETLAAIPLKADLSLAVPQVVNGVVVNNVINLGEAVYWLPRYNGYFHANSEIIKYDAVEYSVGGVGTVWIGDTRTYTEYFSQLGYNQKIYPTGNVRIFAEPKYTKSNGETVLVEGPVSRHGRGQFGTKIVTHKAGIDKDHWTQKNVSGVEMNSKLLFADKYITEKKITGVNSASGSKYFKFPARFKKYVLVGQNIKGNDKLRKSTKISNVYYSANKLKANLTNKGAISGGSITLSGKSIYDSSLIPSAYGTCGIRNKNHAKKSTRTSLIKNYMNNTYGSETSPQSPLAAATLQSSALVFTGPEFSGTGITPLDYVSYVYKSLNGMGVSSAAHKHFGTRMRIIGTDAADPTLASSTGSETVFSDAKLKGSSGGIGIMVNPKTNSGYFLEVMALTDENMGAYKSDSSNDNDLADTLFNLALYKTEKQTSTNGYENIVNSVTNIKGYKKSKKHLKYFVSNSVAVGDKVSITGTSWNISNTTVIARDDTYVILKYAGSRTLPNDGATASGDRVGSLTVHAKAVPKKIWTGMANIITDNGMFTGQQRLTGQDNPSVYDVAIEYEEVKGGGLKFYIYLNNMLVGTAVDGDPIPKNRRANNVALFVRGSSRVMFEHLYALGSSVSTNYRNSTYAPFKDNINLNKEMNTDSAFGKYSMPKAVQTSYFKGISPIAPPAYDMYYEEFGTIMREAKYYNITYDKAYPAFRSMIAPSYNPIKGYAVSGYVSTPYSAEFLVFNTMDSALVFGDNQNPLNIIGVAFTNQADYNYSMDDYLTKMSDYSNYEMLTKENTSGVAFDPSLTKKVYQNIRNSRTTYGKNQFTIDGTYIQTQADAERIMEWMINKTSEPKKSIGVRVFGMPHVQLGDVLKVHHTEDGANFVNPDSLFVVYNIEYSGSGTGPETTLYLSEVATRG